MGHFYIELIYFRIVPSCNRRAVATVNKYLAVRKIHYL
nr:MAG TPA: hypothetical protein [Herelleviridae sp.]